MYEVVLKSPSGIKASCGVYNNERVMHECEKLRKTLEAKYGVKAASLYSVNLILVRQGA